jgi:hypothetical protein
MFLIDSITFTSLTSFKFYSLVNQLTLLFLQSVLIGAAKP